MPHYFNHSHTELSTIPVSLMTKLVAHPDLFVIQTEYSIYVMLKYWMYLIHHKDDKETNISNVNEYFCSRSDKTPYLYCTEGRGFIPVFQGLRLQNLISHLLDVLLITRDNIIPKSWLNPVILQQWRNVLRVNQNEDKGPHDISDDQFLKDCLRCGRVIKSKDRHVWRWTGFHFGIDLLMISDESKLSIKRNQRAESENVLLSFQPTRHVAIRVTVVRLNEQKQIIYSKQSDVQKINMSKGGEVQIMTLDKDLEYPIFISANIMYSCPETV
ncbi:hypothetical protein GWI33_012176 [Rhynchophorus ferrugineus]|uniref:Protein germ cell-less n=1 Tax=Rhynchophorus ferrugineus TaxID=354439 RepID=A0A834IBY6_RHYFE|nr:hypothetical protein GWI33_012176 [Rhynchophorus ferrugineus]